MKDAYWFAHDSNARFDPKSLALIARHGMAGYGLWWVLVEILREQPGYNHPIGKLWQRQALAKQLTADGIDGEVFLKDCLDVELLQEDGKRVWSPSLLRRMQRWDSTKEKLSEGGKLGASRRWQAAKQGGDSPPNREPNAPPNGQPNSKEEYRREENIKHMSPADAADPSDPSAPLTPETICRLWNDTCGDLLTRVDSRIPPGRRQHIKTRAAVKGRDQTWWSSYFLRVRGSPYCCGEGKPKREGEAPWKATLDWATRSEDVVTRVLEGQYGSRPQAKPKPLPVVLPPEPTPEEFAQSRAMIADLAKQLRRPGT